MKLLENKIAIVSGVGSGMGTEQVRALVQQGAKVVGFDITPGDAHKLSTEISESEFVFLIGDVRQQNDWHRVVQTCVDTFGPPSVLVNNAGVLGLDYAESVSEMDYRRVIDINQVGVFLGMQTVAEQMQKNGGGSIVNICSTSGLVAFSGNFSYVASKWAVRGMTRAAALELAGAGIRVNTICPGETDTPLIQNDPTLSPPESLPLGRWARTDEIASAVVYLASDMSSYVSGSDLVVDGAYTAA